MIDPNPLDDYIKNMIIIFTDLDGTLLEESTYRADPAMEALHRIRELGLPIVFCTSKTKAEVEYWRATLDVYHPFVVENGGALYIPDGYFPNGFHFPARRDAYGVFEFGDPHSELVTTLQQASQETGCKILGFHEMSPKELNRRYGLSLEQSRLAKIREYDEPFEILDANGGFLLKAIERHGKHWTRGGRLYHITGHSNKANGVCLLAYYYRSISDGTITVGLGDGLNDKGFLRCVDIPVIIRSNASEKLKSELPRARVTEFTGPEGWNRAVLDILDEQEAEIDVDVKEASAKFQPLTYNKCFQTIPSSLT